MNEYQMLMNSARNPGDIVTLALGGVLARTPIHGLASDELSRLRETYFPSAGGDLARCFEVVGEDDKCPAFRKDEFADIVELLLDHRHDDSEGTRWLAYAVGTACLANNHLWQDMGLPSRDALSELLRTCFGDLYAKNTRNMKWKRFFYKQLCDRAEVNLCKAPSCNLCADYAVCFGPEDADSSVGC